MKTKFTILITPLFNLFPHLVKATQDTKLMMEAWQFESRLLRYSSVVVLVILRTCCRNVHHCILLQICLDCHQVAALASWLDTHIILFCCTCSNS